MDGMEERRGGGSPSPQNCTMPSAARGAASPWFTGQVGLKLLEKVSLNQHCGRLRTKDRLKGADQWSLKIAQINQRFGLLFFFA